MRSQAEHKGKGSLRIKFLASFIFLSLILTLGACKSGTTLLIEGMVTDSTNGSPIIGATIELRKNGFRHGLARVNTNQTGHYSLEYRLEGRCSGVLLYITASAHGYWFESYHFTNESHVRCTDETQTINFELEPL